MLKEEFYAEQENCRNLFSTLMKRNKYAYSNKYFEKIGILRTHGKECKGKKSKKCNFQCNLPW